MSNGIIFLSKNSIEIYKKKNEIPYLINKILKVQFTFNFGIHLNLKKKYKM